MTRGLREILIEAANAIADAIEGKAGHGPPSKGRAASAPQSETSDQDERSERMRQAYNERAAGDRRELEAWAKKRPLSDEETAVLAILGAGYRLMPKEREKLGLTTPLRDREKGRVTPRREASSKTLSPRTGRREQRRCSALLLRTASRYAPHQHTCAVHVLDLGSTWANLNQ